MEQSSPIHYNQEALNTNGGTLKTDIVSYINPGINYIFGPAAVTNLRVKLIKALPLFTDEK